MNKEDKKFVEYVLSFYGSDGIYGNDTKYISSPFTEEEVKTALGIRKVHPQFKDIEFGGDSFDREIVRDIVLRVRDPQALVEHNVNVEGYLLAEKLTEELKEEPIKKNKPKV